MPVYVDWLRLRFSFVKRPHARNAYHHQHTRTHPRGQNIGFRRVLMTLIEPRYSSCMLGITSAGAATAPVGIQILGEHSNLGRRPKHVHVRNGSAGTSYRLATFLGSIRYCKMSTFTLSRWAQSLLEEIEKI